MARDVKPRTQPLIQPALERRTNFNEVILGYSAQEAQAEAQRCLLCKNARCQAVCPLGNQIPRWIGALQQGQTEQAYRILRETSPMPELCSRLCPQERLCEGACALGIKHESVAIGLLERFVTDEARRRAITVNGRSSLSAAKRAAVVGSGPAGLAFAQALARAGHAVTVFERWAHPGGVLRWIPRFKLPTELLQDHVTQLQQLGVSFRTQTNVPSAQALLDEGFDAVFLGIGASRPSQPKLPGVQLRGILSSTEFLVRAFYDHAALPNGWEPLTNLLGARVVVLGGGDSAMDCLRTAIRLGASEVTCVYRRDEANMPGSKKEVKAAKEEGVRFEFLAAPVTFRSHDGKTVSSVECTRMALGEPDASGRRSPQPVPGSRFLVAAQMVILAFGYEVEGGAVAVNPTTGATAQPGIFAGGDCVTGPSLVSTAARAGLVAAQGAQRYFAGESWEALAPTAVAAAQ